MHRDVGIRVASIGCGLCIAVMLLVFTKQTKAQTLTVSPTSLTINEGETGTFTVALSSQPTGDVTVTVTAADDPDRCGEAHGASCTNKSGVATVDKSSLTFTASNWADQQTVTVTATDEDMAGVFKFAKITNQLGDNKVTVSVTVLEDDVRDVKHYLVGDDGTSIGDPRSVDAIWESRSDWGFYTRLNSEPSATTTITPTSRQPEFLTVPSQTLTFTSSNWNDPQFIRFGSIDNWIDEEGKGIHQVRKGQIDLTLAGTGSDYNGYSAVHFTVVIWNEDVAGIVLSPTTLTISEGEEAQYSVKLSSEPTTTVTVELSGHEGTDLNLDKTSLSFTAANWRVAQTVNVTAEGDADGVDETVTLVHASSGGEYNDLTANLPSTVTDVNEWPAVSASCDPCTVSWGRPVSLAATASDPDGGVLTYEWSAPDGRFGGRTDNEVVQWIAPDEPGTVSISIAVEDGQGGSALATVDVKVVNAAPQFGSAAYHFELAENLDGRLRPIEVGQLTASDADGDALTFSLVSGNRDLFALGSEDGVVTYVGHGEDFETDPSRYNLTVLARDPVGEQAKAEITVTVTDVNETPTISASCDPCTVSRGGQVHLAATASDPDGDVLTYEWSAPNGRFGGRTNTAVVRWIAPDEAGTATISVTIEDGRGGSASVTVDVEVVNAVPRFWPAVYHFVLEENLEGRHRPVELGQLTALDPDHDALTYSLMSGDRDLFAVGADDGLVTYVGPGEDFETGPGRYGLMVQAQDAFGGKAEAEITVMVADVNEKPTVSVSCDPCRVSRGGEVRLAATALDPDGDEVTYEWSAPDGRFSEDTESAVVRWTAPDVAGQVIIRVAVEDGRGGSTVATVNVDVANATPRFGSAVYHFELAENLDGRHRPVELGQLMASDFDGDALTYSLVSGSRDLFAVGAEDGVVTYVGPGEDFETDPSLYNLTGVAQDAVGGEAEVFITVTVTDVNETPTVSASCDPCTVSRGGEVRLTAKITDPDGDVVTCVWISPSGHFRGHTDSTIVHWIAPDEAGSATIGVTVEDGRGGSAFATVDVAVANSAPYFSQSVYPFELAENLDGRQMPVELGQLMASDFDGDALTYSLVSGSRDLFAVGADDGVVTYVGPGEDFETGPGRYDLTGVAQDAVGGEAEAKITVMVTDVNETPTVSVSCDPCEVSRGGDVRMAAAASDPDGDAVTYEWSASDGYFGGRTDSAVVHWTASDVPGRVIIGVEVADGRGGLATATTELVVVNAPPHFLQSVYHFELTENLDGRHRPVEIGQLTASDPDGDALTYSLVSGDRDLFAVGTEDGVLTYVGPGEDFETGPGRYGLTLQAQDAAGGKAEAEITVMVTDVNETPTVSVSCDPCEVSRGGEVRMAAAASDPDGDAVTYEWSASNGHFGGRTDSAVVLWTAPDVPGHVIIGVDVADGRGGLATATTELVVVNAPPHFLQSVYHFELTENLDGRHRPVELGQLTASDPDGDALTYSLVSGDRDLFAVGIEDGVLTYVGPGEDFETGPDRYGLMLQAQDAAGGKAEAEITVAVTDVNETPVVVAVIPDQVLDEGGGTVEVALSPFFGDADGDDLIYYAQSSDLHVVQAAVTNSFLTLTPVVYGSTTVTVTAEDTKGLRAMQSLLVHVRDGPQRALLETMLAATVRAHLASLKMTIGRRLNANHCESPRLKVRGRPVPLGGEAIRATLDKLMNDASSAVALGLRGRSSTSYRATGQFTANQRLVDFKAVPMQVLGSGATATGTTELVLVRDIGKENRGGCRESRPLVLWSQGGVQSFSGKPETYGYESNYDGELWTGYIGLDARLSNNWTAGLALSRNRSVGDWRTGTSDGELTQTMFAIHPFLRWVNETTSVWALVGRGKGNAENVRTAGRLGASAMDLRLGLVELETRLGRSGRLGFSLTGDASWAELQTEKGEESLDGQVVRVNQVRIGTKSSVPVRGGRSGLTLFGEVHARRDGGAGQTGYGIELAGGLRAGQGIVRLNAQARILVLHSAAGYQEWGSALTLTVGRPGAEGLSLMVSPQWGDAASGTGSLWQGSLDRDFQIADRDRWTLDARANYGITHSGRRRLDVFGTYNLSLGEPSFGLRLGLPGGSFQGP